MTILYTDPIFLEHDTGGAHPERRERLLAVSTMLEKSGLMKRCTPGAFEPIELASVAKVHAREEIESIQELASHGGGYTDPDTVVSPGSFRVALAAAGAGVAAVDALLSGRDRTALCLVRPPGHHATPQQSMGFCLFNTIALAARRALDQHQVNRLLIVDWDVHHGNGTQDIFYADPQVLFYSIHRYGNGFYPGTGAANETGTGPGLGHTLNMPIAYGTPRRVYH
ncbi:MAG TPA: histone deacetylase, partial [Gemmataceae bacterium]|nr:histone deacetylase [Gemmataceae bacterium]